MNKTAAKKPASQDDTVMKVIIGVIIALAAILVIAGIALAVPMIKDYIESNPNAGKANMNKIEKEINSMNVSDFSESDEQTDYVKITVKDHGDVIIRLRPDIAPITVENFKGLVAQKFYDGLTFHRVMKGFMIQGGAPKGDGTGGSGVTIKGEYSANGVRNELSHIKGVISMARRDDNMNSATSQFFITNADARQSLDTLYASFGYVVAGLETVDSISDVKVKANASGEMSQPEIKIVIEKACFVKKN